MDTKAVEILAFAITETGKPCIEALLEAVFRLGLSIGVPLWALTIHFLLLQRRK